MKISILVIAHNEEKYIKSCISSLLNQTKQIDEIILIAHNCTDNTIKIAGQFHQVQTIPHRSTRGTAYARLEGLKYVTGDIILCIDGDSIAKKNWVKEMVSTLQRNDNILVGSWVAFSGTFFGTLANILNKFNCKTRNKQAIHWVWGPSFGFWNKDIETVKEILHRSIELSQKLSLSRNPDDFWLATFMSRKGNIEVINKTYVTQHQKEETSAQAIQRNSENIRNGKIIEAFLKANNTQ